MARVKEKKKKKTKNNGGGGGQRRERERVSRQKDVFYIEQQRRGESKIGTPPLESSLVPSFDCVLRDADYSVVDVNDDTKTTTT